MNHLYLIFAGVLVMHLLLGIGLYQLAEEYGIDGDTNFPTVLLWPLLLLFFCFIWFLENVPKLVKIRVKFYTKDSK